MVKKISILIITICAILIFFIVLIQAIFFSSTGDITAPAGNRVSAADDYPITLSIPALKINAKVQEVGVTNSGKMAVPNNFTDVGWYKYGTVPGDDGSAVIAGHVDDGLSFPGVFVNLNQLQTGDDIYLTMKDGKTLHYVMTTSQSYDKDASTDSVFNDNSGKLLKLITCTGTWLPTERTHNQRLVVTAVLKKK